MIKKQKKTKVVFGCVILLALFVIHEGKVKLRTNADIQAHCDQNVTLPCDIISSNEIKLSEVYLAWVEESTERLLCMVNNGGVNSFFGTLCDNTTHNLTLTLTHVVPANQGMYICKLRSNVGIEFGKSTVALTNCLRKIEGRVQNGSQIECQFHGFYPNGTVHWSNGTKNMIESSSIEIHMDQDGLFNVISTLRIQSGTGPYNCSLWIPSTGTYLTSKLVSVTGKLKSVAPSLGRRIRLHWVLTLVGFLMT